ncbi:unnamed protein product [Clonostachys rosea f. rosea IK726]|uniref:Uncharacterized protein n=1 Tax=Clonostachys rosea f. rosea IK726 TaxID=1349383 RepID=A0ACA9UBM7_BIOOC|nr:unnamed protein product [Clonostachys rosea f. rosea IK726]
MFANEIRDYDPTIPVFPMDIDSDGGFVNPELTQFRRLKEKASRGATQLKEIVAREGQGSFDWLDLARRIRVPISLVDLWQISPEGAHNSDKSQGGPTWTASSQRSRLVQASSVEAEAKPRPPVIQVHSTELRSPKAFRIDVTIGFGRDRERRYALPPNASQADQGSDCNMISFSLVSQFKMPTRTLASVGFKGPELLTADGKHTPVENFVEVQVATMGIKKDI